MRLSGCAGQSGSLTEPADLLSRTSEEVVSNGSTGNSGPCLPDGRLVRLQVLLLHAMQGAPGCSRAAARLVGPSCELCGHGQIGMLHCAPDARQAACVRVRVRAGAVLGPCLRLPMALAQMCRVCKLP